MSEYQWGKIAKHQANFNWKDFVGGGVQSLSCIRLFATPWTAAWQTSLSFTISWSLFELMSIESVMLSNHLILCRPLFLPSIFSSITVFSNESAFRITWPKYWSLSSNFHGVNILTTENFKLPSGCPWTWNRAGIDHEEDSWKGGGNWYFWVSVMYWVICKVLPQHHLPSSW